MVETLEYLSNKIIDMEKINNDKNKQNSFIINGREFKSGHPSWNKKSSPILYAFQSCLHDENKIFDLIKKCGWTLINSRNHKKYNRNTPRGNIQTLICPCSPKTTSGWKSVWCELKKYEIELIMES